MDIFQHLLPGDCQVPQSPCIPYIGSLEFDGGTFQDYPARLGFSMSGSSELEMEIGNRYDEHTALLQTWLYFGLIATMSSSIGLEINLSDLVREQEPGSIVVDCVAVGSFLRQWLSHVDTVLTRENWKIFATTFSQALSVSLHNARLHDFDASVDGELSSSKQRAAILLSVKALLRAFYSILLIPRSFGSFVQQKSGLHRWKGGVYRHRLGNIGYFSTLIEPVRLLYDASSEILPPSAMVARRFLESNGWCPTHAKHILLNAEIESVYEAAALRSVPGTGVSHKQCNEDKGCVAASIDNSEFRPLHIEEDCQCAVIRPDMGIVNSIIEASEIPVIEIRRSEASKWSLIAKSAQAQLDYTAISHVWTDGYADSSTNGLFACQLSRIVQDVQLIRKETSLVWGLFERKEISPLLGWLGTKYRRPPDFAAAIRLGHNAPVTIWMDALCIPAYDPRNAETSLALKRRAINFMTPTYAGASEVLVIDKTIQTRDYTTYSDLRKGRTLLRMVRFAPWMFRSWTLQEGALARKLYVRTAKFPELVDHLRLPLNPRFWGQRLITSLNWLSARDTSQKDDLYQIIANICLLDSSELTGVPPELRFQALLNSLSPEFPFGLLLRKNTGKDHDHTDDWWIPACEDRIHLPLQDRELVLQLTEPVDLLALKDIRTGDLALQQKYPLIKGSTRAIFQSLIRCFVPQREYKESAVVPITDRLGRHIWADGLVYTESPEQGWKDRIAPAYPKMKKLAALRRAVLHDQGVVFDATALGYTVISTEGRPPQTFRLSVLENTYWITLDRDLTLADSAVEVNAPHPMFDTNPVLLLPTMKDKLDAEGTIGRGLFLSPIGFSQSLLIPSTLTPYTNATVWQATPSRFNSAFTCGLVTKRTSGHQASAPLLRGYIIPATPATNFGLASAFLIPTNTASWPVLQNVRTESSLYRDYATSWVYPIGILIFVGLVGGNVYQIFAGTVTAGRRNNWLGLLRVVACLVWPLLIAINSFSGRALERRIRHRRWVITFHPTTPEMRSRYASRGFRFRMQVVDVLYKVFLLDPIFQFCIYLSSSVKKLRETSGRFREDRTRFRERHLEGGEDLTGDLISL